MRKGGKLHLGSYDYPLFVAYSYTQSVDSRYIIYTHFAYKKRAFMRALSEKILFYFKGTVAFASNVNSEGATPSFIIKHASAPIIAALSVQYLSLG